MSTASESRRLAICSIHNTSHLLARIFEVYAICEKCGLVMATFTPRWVDFQKSHLDTGRIFAYPLYLSFVSVSFMKYKGLAFHAQSRAVAETRKDMESVILLQVRQAWLDMNESKKRSEVARESLGRADESLQVTRNRYQDGIGTNTEVLAAESMRMQSYAHYDAARHDAALAIVRLRYAGGNL